MSNFRFQEYVTSGAFNLSLSRTQVAALARVASGEDHYACSATAALERKGLIEAIAAPVDYQPDRMEYRATAAGLLCASMMVEAGLSSGPRGALAGEVATLQTIAEDARLAAHSSKTVARSALARLDDAEQQIANLKARAGQAKLSIRIGRRDPLPETTTADLLKMATADGGE